MAIQSWGYGPTTANPDGTVADPASWFRVIVQGARARYWVNWGDALRVTPVVGGTRQVTVKQGWCGSGGITDLIDADETVQLPTVASGTQYFLVVARRTWGTTNATTLEVITGGSTGDALPSFNTDPGTVDDQPLALVSLTAGATDPVVVHDVRAISEGAGSITILDKLALSYLTQIGTIVNYGTEQWVHTYPSGGGPRYWQQLPNPYSKSPIQPVFSFSSGVGGWSALNAAGTDGSRGWLDGNTAMIMLRMRNISANISFNSVGNPVGGDVTIGNLGRPEFWPDFQLDGFGAQIATPSGGAVACTVGLGVKGDIILQSGPPNQSVRKSATDFALTGTMTYIIGRVS